MAERTFGSIKLKTSNEDKIFFPESKLTKGDLIEYYVKVAEHLLPHVKDRPMTLYRSPDGIKKQGFVQQKISDYFPDWLPTTGVRMKTRDKEITHPMAEKAADLAYLANQGTISLHVWLSRTDKPESPDMVVFDLDPPEDGGFDVVRQAARDLQKLMDELGLVTYVKTTGSKGLHVIAPLSRGRTFKEARDFAGDAAKLMAHRNPDEYTVEFSKDKRQGKLFLDTRRNAYAQTVVAPYSVRARPGAPVAMPISWDELGDSSIGPRSFTIENAFNRLGQKDDPWAGMRRHGRDLKNPKNALRKLMDEAGLDTD